MTDDDTIGVALPPAHALPLSRALAETGLRAEVATTPALVKALVREGHCRLWVFDDTPGTAFEALAKGGTALLPVESLPDHRNPEALESWCRAQIQRIRQVGKGRKVLTRPTVQDPAVWLLAGSAGATPAIQSFLNALDDDVPVAFVYAQHYDVAKRAQLAEMVSDNPSIDMTLLDTHARLAGGSVVILSPSCRFALSSPIIISLPEQPWKSRYTPSLSEAIAILGGANVAHTGVIVFSGMGEDGAEALPAYTSHGGVVWAQSPESAVCAAMPQAAIDTGLVSLTSTPEGLAEALSHRYVS